MADIAAFWSYTHKDDDTDGGRVVRLGTSLADEIEALTGEAPKLFLDKDKLQWGDEWRDRIEEELRRASFFIPLLTPRYFQSVSCRKELLQFVGDAKSLGKESLLLPILYIPVAGLADGTNSEDEAVSLVDRFQLIDWTALRFADERGHEFRSAVHNLATRMIGISEELDSRVVASIDDDHDSQGGDEEPGLLEILAEGEEALNSWPETMDRWNELMERVSSVMASASGAMNRAEIRGKGFAGKLAVSRQLAIDLQELADEMQPLSEQFFDEQLHVDPMVLEVLRIAEANSEQIEDLRPFLKALNETGPVLIETAGSADELIRVMGTLLPQSRELRKPLRSIQASVQRWVDVGSVVEQWMERAAEVEASAKGDDRSDNAVTHDEVDKPEE